MSQENVEVVRRLYDAWVTTPNFARLWPSFDPEIVCSRSRRDS